MITSGIRPPRSDEFLSQLVPLRINVLNMASKDRASLGSERRDCFFVAVFFSPQTVLPSFVVPCDVILLIHVAYIDDH